MQNEEKTKRSKKYVVNSKNVDDFIGTIKNGIKKNQKANNKMIFEEFIAPYLNAEINKGKEPCKKTVKRIAMTLRDVKMEEDKNWENCHEIEGESERTTLFPYELKKLVYGHYRGSRGKDRASLKSTILLIIALAVVTILAGYLIYQIGGYKIAYATNPAKYIYKSQCGHIPLEEQGEKCSILRAKVIKTDNRT